MTVIPTGSRRSTYPHIEFHKSLIKRSLTYVQVSSCFSRLVVHMVLA